MSRNHITATFRGDITVSRNTDAAYTHASRDRTGNVRFHTSAAAANRVAGATVVRTDFDAPADGSGHICWMPKCPSRDAHPRGDGNFCDDHIDATDADMAAAARR
jgi:hypothetical protein